MAIRPVGKLRRVKNASSGARESDALFRARHHREKPAPKRTLRQVGGVVRPPAAQVPNRLPESKRRAVRPTLVVANDVPNVGVVSEDSGAFRSHEYIHRATPGELRNERRREYDVAKKARLDNERSHRSINLQHGEEGLLRYLHRADLLHSLFSFQLHFLQMNETIVHGPF